MMTTNPTTTTSLDQDYDWKTHRNAATAIAGCVEAALDRSVWLQRFRDRLFNETGTRLIDWLDHLAVPDDSEMARSLTAAGFKQDLTERAEPGSHVFRNGLGLFPAILLHKSPTIVLGLKVDSASDFLFAHQIDQRTRIAGALTSGVRIAKAIEENDVALKVVERHGSRAFTPDAAPNHSDIFHYQDFIRRRRRVFDDAAEGFTHTTEILWQFINQLGRDRTCDLFFAAEREYWQSRNRAARIQKQRQDSLGLGWANHDHHTYRSSRENFTQLIAVLEMLGFECRERFYGGREAGWGAQVLEHQACGVVIFADVDLSAEEVAGDFAHDGLPSRDQLGTVGLWCKLHGEAFLEAGMHHLECQFDFDAARKQLGAAGVETMKPFSDFHHLKQAFTKGEQWPVSESRIAAALSEGYITSTQAKTFSEKGAVGSHLEILQREDGYKGFNQTGISEIILETDPRKAVV